MRGYWLMTDHVCAACLGRVLVGAAKPTEYRCSNCGATGDAVGSKPGSVCACRMRIGSRDAGMRCAPNPNPRPELLSEIIVKETT